MVQRMVAKNPEQLRTLMEEYSLRPLTEVELTEGAKPNDPGACPDIVWVRPEQVLISEEYQRHISRGSIRKIYRMATNWDWNKFKVLSLAECPIEGYYECTDGQHSAIAAKLNGHILLLPGLVGDAASTQQKASGFLGINRERTALSHYDIFNASLAAGEDNATSVWLATQFAGVRILETPPADRKYQPGDTLAIGSLSEIYRQSGIERLKRILLIGKHGEARPFSAVMIKALQLALPKSDDEVHDSRLAEIIKGQGAIRLEAIAKSKTPPHRRIYETLAADLRALAGIPEPARPKIGRPRKQDIVTMD